MAGKHDKAEVKEAENNIMKQVPEYKVVREDPDKVAIKTLKEKHAKAMKYIEKLEREKLQLTDTINKQSQYIARLKEAIIREVTR